MTRDTKRKAPLSPSELRRAHRRGKVIGISKRPDVETANITEAVRRAADDKRRVRVRHRGRQVAIIPLRDLRLLERLIEQEEDRLDVEEAERRLEDPAEVPIPYERARPSIGLGPLSD